MALFGGPIYKGGRPAFKPGIRVGGNAEIIIGGISAGPPTSGTSGTLAGKAGLGSIVYDTTTGNQWMNIGTQASPNYVVSEGPLGCISTTIQLTSANILAMFTTPVALLPAPGAGLFLLIDTISLAFHVGGTQYASGGVVTCVYHGGSVTPHSSSIAAAVINAASSSNNILPPITASLQPPANTGLDITNATGAFTTGTGTATVQVWYSIVATA